MAPAAEGLPALSDDPGPTLGGWMTDNMSWRWVFYINVPVGILSAAMCFLFLEDPLI
jgi:MFS family permease